MHNILCAPCKTESWDATFKNRHKHILHVLFAGYFGFFFSSLTILFVLSTACLNVVEFRISFFLQQPLLHLH